MANGVTRSTHSPALSAFAPSPYRSHPMALEPSVLSPPAQPRTVFPTLHPGTLSTKPIAPSTPSDTQPPERNHLDEQLDRNQSPRFVRKRAYTSFRNTSEFSLPGLSHGLSPTLVTGPVHSEIAVTTTSSLCQLLPAVPSPVVAVATGSEPRVTHLPRHRRSATFNAGGNSVAGANGSGGLLDSSLQSNGDRSHLKDIFGRDDGQKSYESTMQRTESQKRPTALARQPMMKSKLPPPLPAPEPSMALPRHASFDLEDSVSTPSTPTITTTATTTTTTKPTVSLVNSDLFRRAGEAYQLLDSAERQLTDALAVQSQGHSLDGSKSDPPVDVFPSRETPDVVATVAMTLADMNCDSFKENFRLQQSSTHTTCASKPPVISFDNNNSKNNISLFPGIPNSYPFPPHPISAATPRTLTRRTQQPLRQVCTGLRTHRPENAAQCDVSGCFVSPRCLGKIFTLDGLNWKSSRPWKEYFMCISGCKVRFVKASSAHCSTGCHPKTAAKQDTSDGVSNLRGDLANLMTNMTLEGVGDEEGSSRAEDLLSVEPPLEMSTSCLTLPISGLSWHPVSLPSDLPRSWLTNSVDQQQAGVEVGRPLRSAPTLQCYRFLHCVVGAELLFVFPDKSATATCLKLCEVNPSHGPLTNPLISCPNSSEVRLLHSATEEPVVLHREDTLGKEPEQVWFPRTAVDLYSGQQQQQCQSEHTSATNNTASVITAQLPSFKEKRQRISAWHAAQSFDTMSPLLDGSGRPVVDLKRLVASSSEEGQLSARTTTDSWRHMQQRRRSRLFIPSEKPTKSGIFGTAPPIRKALSTKSASTESMADDVFVTTEPVSTGDCQQQATAARTLVSNKTVSISNSSGSRAATPFLRGIRQWLNRPSIGASTLLSVSASSLSAASASKSDSIDRRLAAIFDNPPDLSEYENAGPVFGAPLEMQIESPDFRYVPVLLHAFVVALDAHGLAISGLYRKPGRHRAIAQFVCTVNLVPFNLDLLMKLDAWREPHAICGLIKLFMRRLPVGLLNVSDWEPLALLVPEEETSKTAADADAVDGDQQPFAYQLAFLLMSVRVKLKRMLMEAVHSEDPVPAAKTTSASVWRWFTLQFLVTHIRSVVSQCHLNEVSYQCVAICFGPTFFDNSPQVAKLNVVLEHMFRHWHWLTDGLSSTLTSGGGDDGGGGQMTDPTLPEGIDYVISSLREDRVSPRPESSVGGSANQVPGSSLEQSDVNANVCESVRSLLERAFESSGISITSLSATPTTFPPIKDDCPRKGSLFLPLKSGSSSESKHWFQKYRRRGASHRSMDQSCGPITTTLVHSLDNNGCQASTQSGGGGDPATDGISRIRRTRRTAPPRSWSLPEK